MAAHRSVELALVLESGEQNYTKQLDRARNHFTGLDGEWTGASFDAAYNRIGEDHDQGRKLAFEIREFATALRNGETRLADERRILLGKVTDAENDHPHGANFTISERWQIVAEFPDAATEAERGSIFGIAYGHQDAINAAYHSLVHAINEVVAAITTNGHEIRARGDQLGEGIYAAGPAGWTSDRPLTGELGTEDGEALADGTLTPEEAARLATHLEQADLTPEQLDALANGEQATVPASTVEYLTNLYDKAGRDGLLQVSEQLRTEGTPESQQLRQNLANGLMTVSNQDVVAKDKTGKVVDQGSWNKLDPEVQELIGTRVQASPALPDGNSGLPEEYLGNGGTQRYTEDMAAMAGLLSSAEQGYEPGDRFGVELSRQAAHQVSMDADPNAAVMGYTGSDEAIQQLLDAGTRSKEANYALLTGDASEEVLGPGEYHRDDVVVPLLQHEWADDGDALGDMFAWINEDARVEPGMPPTPANEAAGRAAFGLAQILATTESGRTGENLYESWLDLPGLGSQSLGEANPVLTQELARATSPYTGRLVGMSDGLSETAGFENLGGPQDASRLFTVLNGDPEAAALINGSALAESQRLDQVFAEQELNGTGNTDLGYYGNRLQWLVNTGIDGEIAERQGDADQTAEDTAARRSAAYTAAQIIVGGFGPGPAVLASVSEGFKAGFIGVEPPVIGPHSPLVFEGEQYHSSTFGTESGRKYGMIEHLVNTGAVDFGGLPEEFKNGDRMKSYSEILMDAADPDRNSDQQTGYTAALDAVLEGAGIDTSQVGAYSGNADGSEDSRIGSEDNRWPHPV